MSLEITPSVASSIAAIDSALGRLCVPFAMRLSVHSGTYLPRSRVFLERPYKVVCVRLSHFCSATVGLGMRHMLRYGCATVKDICCDSLHEVPG